jgi:hypothetical protein
MDEAELWAALAVKPIDGDSALAREEMWGPARRSLRLGMLVCALIFLAVPPIYLFDTFVPLLIGAPLILAVAIFGAVRAIGSGGEVDQAFDGTGAMMRPLGLELVERPEIRMEVRAPPLFGANARLRGPIVLEGKRNGRSVSVNQEDNTSVTSVRGSAPPFEAKARDGRIRAADGAAPAVAAALEEIPNSTRWKGVEVERLAERL